MRTTADVLKEMAIAALYSNSEKSDAFINKMFEYDRIVKAYRTVCRNLRRNERKRLKFKKYCEIKEKSDEDMFISLIQREGVDVVNQILSGTYRPNPVYRTYVDKKNGKKRALGVSVPIDRFVQQLIAQMLVEQYEDDFSKSSYGFRKQRGTSVAVEECFRHIDAGNECVVHLDIKKCFDSFNHQKLICILMKKIKDGRFLHLLNRYLRAGVIIGKKWYPTYKGAPQGSPLSPICANIYLNELDNYLESKGITFVRYADDIVLFFRDIKEAQMVVQPIRDFLRAKLHLRLNMEKTTVCYAEEIEFLGYGFKRNMKNGKFSICIGRDAKNKIMERISERVQDSENDISEIQKSINGYIQSCMCSRYIEGMEMTMVMADNHCVKVLNHKLWNLWNEQDMVHRKIDILGIEGYDEKFLKSFPVLNWGKGRYKIATKYLNQEILSSSGFLFFKDVYDNIIKKQKIKSCMAYAFLK